MADHLKLEQSSIIQNIGGGKGKPALQFYLYTIK